MPKVKVMGKSYDFTELGLKDALEIEEKVIGCVTSLMQGGQMPTGTLFDVAEKVFQFLEVDGKPVDDINQYFAPKEKRAEFHAALVEGLKLNFSDLFIQLIDTYAPDQKEKLATVLKQATVQ